MVWEINQDLRIGVIRYPDQVQPYYGRKLNSSSSLPFHFHGEDDAVMIMCFIMNP